MTKARAPPSGPTSEQCRHLNVSHSCFFLGVSAGGMGTSGLFRDGDVARRCSGKDGDWDADSDDDDDATAEDNVGEVGGGASAGLSAPGESGDEEDDILGLLPLAAFDGAARASCFSSVLSFTVAPFVPVTNGSSSSLQCLRCVVLGSSSAGIWIWMPPSTTLVTSAAAAAAREDDADIEDDDIAPSRALVSAVVPVRRLLLLLAVVTAPAARVPVGPHSAGGVVVNGRLCNNWCGSDSGRDSTCLNKSTHASHDDDDVDDDEVNEAELIGAAAPSPPSREEEEERVEAPGGAVVGPSVSSSSCSSSFRGRRFGWDPPINSVLAWLLRASIQNAMLPVGLS
jgi:hypothetical protein